MMDNQLFYDFKCLLNSEVTVEDNTIQNEQFTGDVFASENVDVTDFEKNIINQKNNLEQRLKQLQATMSSLKKQVSQEKLLWKKQFEESILIDSNQGKTSSINTVDLKSNSNGLTTTEYAEKVNRYEDALLKAHAEKKAKLKRQITINNYKRRLLEVENMCNVELMRVKQSVQHLQPLQLIVSEWKCNTNQNMTNDVEITGFPEEKLNFADRSNDEVASVLSKINCCCVKLPTRSSSTQVCDEHDEEGIGDNLSSYWYPLEK
ncbi:hypothetical protein FQA39_LY00653 [Lamprigera yunnana]|nr:hypothetical protein FQA39_LY00653 [Lamprigera yunnana]